jgi:hypothetical protein
MQTSSQSESSDSDSSSSEEEHVAIGLNRVEETKPGYGGFDASLHGFVGNNHNGGEWKEPYDRNLPVHYYDSEDGQVDTFTRNVLRNYATEGVTKSGKPSGHFFIRKANLRKIAAEVVQTHLNKKGKDLVNYLSAKFDEAWDYYDVNRKGYVDALWSATILRFMCR